ncbi:MAG: GAF domain-containing protein [Chloroflexi bacterium]|nr:GAF domain-containing protein [Chloroflexota bacterium]
MNFYPGSLPFALPGLLISILTAAIAIYAFNRSQKAGAITFGWLTAGMTLWSFLYTLEVLAPTLAGKILLAKFEYIGFTLVPVFWFLFALEYTGHKNWLTPFKRAALIAPPILTFCLALTNEYHRLIWAATSLDPLGYPSLVINGHGSWFWIHTAFSYVLILAGVALYLITYFQTQPFFRKQMALIVIGSTVPLFVNAFTLFTPISLHGFDLTPFGFAFSSVLSAIGFFRYGLMDLIPIASALVMENLHDAVIVLDENKLLADINSAGRNWLKVGNEAIGHNVREALPQLESVWKLWDADENQIQIEFGEENQRRWFDLSITPMRDIKNHLTGHVLVAHDISREQALLLAERNRSHQMELLNSITRASLETATFPEMLQTLADHIGELLQSDGAFITLWDELEQKIIPGAAYGDLRETYPSLKVDSSKDKTLSGAVLEAGHPLAVEDVFNTPYISPSIANRFPTRSLLGLPLVASGTKMGAALISFNQPHQFTTAEIAVGEQAAGQIALAIYKAKLSDTERRRARQLELLNSITRASLEITDFREMLQTLADQMGGLLQSDGAAITLWDELEEKTIPAAAFGELREIYPTMKFDARETTLTESALRAGRSLIIEDSANTPYMSPSISARLPGRSILALPLITHGQKLGAVLIMFSEPHHFTGQEVAIGEQAAAQIALAFNKAQLLDTISRRVVQMGLIQEVGRQMTESLDETEICQRTVEAMVKVFGYDEVAISLLVEGYQLELIAIGGTKDMELIPGFRQNIGQGIVGHVAQTRRQYFTSDITNDPHYYHPSIQTTGTAMGAPLLNEDQLLGVIYVQSAPPHVINPDDVQILQTLSSQLVTAIQKARLYSETRESLKTKTTLQSVSQTINSSLDLETVFNIIVQLLRESFGYTYASIYRLDGETLRLGAQAGYPQESIICEIPVTSGVTGRAIRTRQVQFIRDVGTDSNFLRASYEVESEICVPLLNEDTVLGVLNIESDSHRKLTDRDVELLTAIAGPVSMAIENANLHAKVTSLALTDGMTGLINRRAFDQVFETEVSRAIRYDHPLSLIIIDMDSFKIYNDTFGHPAGDERIKAIAGILLANVRDPDVAARYGGEEFAVILPHTTKVGAVMLAERLRESAEAQSPTPPAPGKPYSGYTISLGVATFPEDGTTAGELLLSADNAELTAKRLGKNRVYAGETSKELPIEQA